MDKKIVAKGGQQHLVAVEQTSFSGPLPAPADFNAYGNTLPDAPERIMKMAEAQSEHRMYMEKKVLKYSTMESITGQVIGFLIAVIFLGAAVGLAMDGHDWLAGGIIAAISSLIAVFVLKKERKDQSDEQ